jgi:hypothetical protein
VVEEVGTTADHNGAGALASSSSLFWLSIFCAEGYKMGFPVDPAKPIPATTTAQQDLTTAGQRRVNLIWEYTQAVIALVVVISTMASGLWQSMHPSNEQLPTIMSVAFGTVVGFYFSRTNHAAIGGLGPKPTQTYEGR